MQQVIVHGCCRAPAGQQRLAIASRQESQRQQI
jgi:hypothetical protein